MKEFRKMWPSPYKIGNNGCGGIKITISKLTKARKGDMYFQYENAEGIIVLVPYKQEKEWEEKWI